MKHFILMLFTTTLCSLAYPQHRRTVVEGVINKEAILSDIDEYMDCIVNRHINAFTQIKKSDFLEEVARIKAESGLINIDELFIRWLQLNAKIGDEHTMIAYKSIARDQFPYDCYSFEEGIFITATTDYHTQYLHSKIIAVNGMPIREVISKIASIVPDTNQAAIRYNLSRFLFDPFVLHGLGIAPSRGSIYYTLVSPKNDTVKITPEAIDKRAIRWLYGFDRNVFIRFQLSSKAKYGYRYIDSQNCVYFNYTTCVDDKKHPFKKIREDLEELIDDRRPGKIIVDLRDNVGGSPRHLQPFIDYLTSSKLNRKGGIYVIVGKKTFSAAILNSVYFREHTYATIIGEETWGSVTHYGEVKFLTLPATKITMSWSTRYVATSERYDGSLRPDVLIPEKFSDYVRGVDAALEYAMTH